MTTRSLILHPHEVLAALAGTLGLVVRPVKPSVKGCKVGTYHIWKDGVAVVEPVNVQEDGDPWDDIPCPLGVPGDRVVCREGWHTDERDLEHAKAMHEDAMSSSPIFYQADPANRNSGCRWRSPATMPRWASRVTLEVVGVRCVRPAGLTEQDAITCGFSWTGEPGQYGDGCQSPFSNLEDFWTAKYAPRYPWETSWAWAVGVRRVEG